MLTYLFTLNPHILRAHYNNKQMEILPVVLSSKLWALGSRRINFQSDPDWTFFYCIEGESIKMWSLVFFNNNLKKIKLRTPILDICLEGVFVQTCQYYSNLYCLVVEYVSSKVSPWVSDRLSEGGCGGGEGAPVGCAVTYFCAPPIMHKDTVRDDTYIQLKKTQYNPLQISSFIDKNHEHNSRGVQPRGKHRQTDNIKIYIGGYFTYAMVRESAKKNRKSVCRKEIHKKYHSPMCWIPSVTVDSETLECQFQIQFERERASGRCLQCLALAEITPVDSLNPMMSNIMINH